MRKKGYLLLLLSVILAFWQIFFLQNGMKWDFVDAFLPSRYFFTESVLNNEFPLWNPYILYGIPIYADMVSVFNPEFWIIANLFGYSNISLQYIYLLYIFVAGFSFNFFIKHYSSNTKLNIALSISYMLSGVTIANAQNLAVVSGFAIIPIVLAFYIQFLKNINTKGLIYFSLSLFVIVFSSYPALTIILVYFLFIIFIYFFYLNRNHKDYLKRILVYHSALVLIVALFSSVFLVSYLQVTPFLNQFNGLSIDIAQQNNFSAKSFLSFVLPMASGKDALFFGTDSSMSNAYFGIISLILLLYSLTRKVKNTESYIYIFFGIFSLLVSLGNQFFLREFLFDYAPLMDMFRYPSLFRVFSIFGFLAFIGINHSVFSIDQLKKKQLITFSISILIVIILIRLTIGQTFNIGRLFTENISLYQFINNLNLHQSITFQSYVQIFIILAFILIIYKSKSTNHFFSLILVLFIFDGVVSTQLSIQNTVIGKTNPIAFSNYLQASPKGFPIPDLQPINQNSDKNVSPQFVWMNCNVFPKRVTYDGLVSFKLNGYTQLADNYPQLLDSIKTNPIIYLSNDIRSNTEVANYHSKTIFLDDNTFSSIENISLKSSQNDSLRIVDFSPKQIKIYCQTRFPQVLTYQQNYYKGWRVYIDGQEENLLNCNFAHMAVLLPAGQHIVSFEYTNSPIKLAFFISYFIFFALLFIRIFLYYKSHPNTKKQVLLLTLSLIIIFIAGSLLNRHLYRKNQLGLSHEIIKNINYWNTIYNDKLTVFLSTQQKELINSIKANSIYSNLSQANYATLSQVLLKSTSPYFAFAWQGQALEDDIKELIYSFYPQKIEQIEGNNSGVVLLKQGQQDYIYTEDFEKHNLSGWEIAQSRLEYDSLKNNHYYKYEARNEWGVSLAIPVDSSLYSLKKIAILSDFTAKNKSVEIPLVFTIEGQNKIWEAININLFSVGNNKWSRVAFVVNIDTSLRKGDRIKIYFWNKNKTSFKIDNLKLKFFFKNEAE